MATHKTHKNRNTAAVIYSFNRPAYLAETLRSLENNTHLEGLDFYFVQDGAVNQFSGRVAAKAEDLDACVALFEASRLPNKRVIRRESNLCVGINQFQTKVMIFEELGYERALFFEDDLVLSQNYLRLMGLMLDQYQSRQEVGVVTCHGEPRRKKSLEEKVPKLDRVMAGNHHLWAWGTWKDRWLKVKPVFLEYYKFIEGIDYTKRPEQQIRDFYKQQGFTVVISSQDTAFNFALFKCGMVGLNTQVNRSRYIGQKGLHSYPERYERDGFGEAVLDEFDQDRTLAFFKDPDWSKVMRLMSEQLQPTIYALAVPTDAALAKSPP